MKRIGLILCAFGIVGAACESSNGNNDGDRGSAGDALEAGADADAAADAATSDARTAPAIAASVRRTDIVSDQPGALKQDPKLINAWGLAFNPAGVAWISENGSGTTEAFDANGNMRLPTITIPAPPGATGPSAPTGVVNNANTNAFRGDAFIFVTEDGTIAGWKQSSGTNAVLEVDNSAKGAVYKGATIAAGPDGKDRLFAANFRAATVDVFDESFANVTTGGGFKDPSIPQGFAPFNVQEVLGGVIVTYALQNAEKHDDVAGAGNGFVDIFDTDGNLIVQLIARGALNSPWGIATAPAGFGKIPFRLLVGNFGDGRINVYGLHQVNGLAQLESEGPLADQNGAPMVIDGLWSLRFGPGAGGFEKNQLFFTAGPGGEMHGVFGRLDLVQQ